MSSLITKRMAWRSVAAAALTGLAALLASCGGGDPAEKFVPDRIIVFGDEASVIESDAFPLTNGGRKYTVNGVEREADGTTLKSPTVRDCTRNPIWVQVLANDYGYQFAECPATSTNPRALMRAQVGSTAAMMSTRISAYMLSPGFTDRDLVTLMVGTHDVLAAAALPTRADALAAASAAGTAVGAEVVRITDRGAKVIVSTIPDVSATPQELAGGRTALLAELTTAFNTALRVKLQDVRLGGHSAGLVLGDELVWVMRRSPATYGIVNLADAACGTSLPDCDESSVVTAAQATRAADWLWAGPLQLGANAQLRLGQAAVARARNNPF